MLFYDVSVWYYFWHSICHNFLEWSYLFYSYHWVYETTLRIYRFLIDKYLCLYMCHKLSYFSLNDNLGRQHNRRSLWHSHNKNLCDNFGIRHIRFWGMLEKIESIHFQRYICACFMFSLFSAMRWFHKKETREELLIKMYPLII